MAPTVATLGGTSSAANGTSRSLTLGATVTYGDTIVVAVQIDNTGTNGAAPASLTVSDSKGHRWKTVLAPTVVDPGAASAGACLAIYKTVCVTPMTTSDTITVTTGSSAAIAIEAAKVTPTSGQYLVLSGSTASATTTAGTSATVTTASLAAGILVFGAVAVERTAVPTADSDTSNGTWNSGQGGQGGNSGTSTTNMAGLLQWKYTTGTGTQTYNVSWTTSTDAVIATMQLVEAAVPVGIYRDGAVFNGTTSAIQLAIAESSALDFGPVSVVAIVKADSVASYFPVLTAATSGDIDRWALYNALGNPGIDNNTGDTSGGTQVFPTVPWVCVVASKATGSAAPRFSMWDAASQEWVHANGSAIPDVTSAGSGGSWWIGYDPQYDLAWDGQIAGVAVFDKVLSDGEREGLTVGGFVLEDEITDLAPVHWWTTLERTVADAVGTADESARTAITLGTESPLVVALPTPSSPPYSYTFTGTDGDPVPADWAMQRSVNGEGTCSIRNNALYQTSEAGNPLVWQGNFLNMEDMGDQEILTAFTVDDPTDQQYPNVSWRLSQVNGPHVRPGKCYDIEFELDNDQVSFYVNTTGEYSGWSLIVTSTSAGIDVADKIWVRVRAVGSDHKIRWWADSDPEPSTWQIEETDATWATGKTALVYYAGLSNSGGVEWDSYSVTEVASSTEVSGTPAVSLTTSTTAAVSGQTDVAGTPSASTTVSTTASVAGQTDLSATAATSLTDSGTADVEGQADTVGTAAASTTTSATAAVTGQADVAGTAGVSVTDSGTGNVGSEIEIAGTPAVSVTESATATVTGQADITGTSATSTTTSSAATVNGQTDTAGTAGVSLTDSGTGNIGTTSGVDGVPAVSVTTVGVVSLTAQADITGTTAVSVTVASVAQVSTATTVDGTPATSTTVSTTGTVAATATVVAATGTSTTASDTATVAGHASVSGTAGVSVTVSDVAAIAEQLIVLDIHSVSRGRLVWHVSGGGTPFATGRARTDFHTTGAAT